MWKLSRQIGNRGFRTWGDKTAQVANYTIAYRPVPEKLPGRFGLPKQDPPPVKTQAEEIPVETEVARTVQEAHVLEQLDRDIEKIKEKLCEPEDPQPAQSYSREAKLAISCGGLLLFAFYIFHEMDLL